MAWGYQIRCCIVLLAVCGTAWFAGAQAAPAGPSADVQLYRALRSVGLDARQVYRVRDASLDREDIHLTFTDGLIAFTQAVDGHVTGAFFQGEGEVLLIPPNQAERASLAFFTTSAVLEERFATAYLRFDDGTAAELSPQLHPATAEEATAFLEQWNPLATSLANTDALRLLLSFATQWPRPERFLHARIGGLKLGTFDVALDSVLAEQISVAHEGFGDAGEYYDIWMSFPMRSARQEKNRAAKGFEPFDVPAYRLNVQVVPPSELRASAEATLKGVESGHRILFFELSRFLKIKSVILDGDKLEFIQNDAVKGSELARRGNDVIAVVLPQPLSAGQQIKLNFSYEGSVMSDAGGGLLYVGARGLWYPSRGPSMASFDVEFRYPAGWTLLATGAQTSMRSESGEQTARWVSERPIPLAGFNLGKYVASSARSGPVSIGTYATHGVEKSLSKIPRPADAAALASPNEFAAHPVAALKPVEQRAVATVEFFSRKISPFPYSSLSLTQIPGPDSQGWPGLIFLSSYAFLSANERPNFPARDREYDELVYDRLMPAHEIAHQWWGDAVFWNSYRDQWLMEALANYSALMEIEARSPQQFRMVLNHYRDDLLQGVPSIGPYTEAGPVTLGGRLASSKFPEGYEKVAYERGTWLIHMLRMMLREGNAGAASKLAKPRVPAEDDAIFFKALALIQHDFAGSSMSTADVQPEFDRNLPAALYFENHASLQWFFDGWVNGNSIPKIEIKDLRCSPRRNTREDFCSGVLTQSNATKNLITAVPLYAPAANANPIFAGRVFAEGEETNFRIKVPRGTRKLIVDPFETILRRP